MLVLVNLNTINDTYIQETSQVKKDIFVCESVTSFPEM